MNTEKFVYAYITIIVESCQKLHKHNKKTSTQEKRSLT